MPGGRDDTFTISWHPFYLDPTAPKAGVPLRERLSEKFGPSAWPAIVQRLTQVGREEGIAFRFDSTTGNTRDSHRLVQLGQTKGGAEGQGRVVAALFRLYFEQGGDITSHESLLAAAEAAGLDRAEARAWLDDDSRGGPEVDREVDEAYAQGIHGVPNFTINDKYQVNGAQDPQTFLEQFARVKAGEKPKEAEGPACAPGGEQC